MPFPESSRTMLYQQGIISPWQPCFSSDRLFCSITQDMSMQTDSCLQSVAGFSQVCLCAATVFLCHSLLSFPPTSNNHSLQAIIIPTYQHLFRWDVSAYNCIYFCNWIFKTDSQLRKIYQKTFTKIIQNQYHTTEEGTYSSCDSVPKRVMTIFIPMG